MFTDGPTTALRVMSQVLGGRQCLLAKRVPAARRAAGLLIGVSVCIVGCVSRQPASDQHAVPTPQTSVASPGDVSVGTSGLDWHGPEVVLLRDGSRIGPCPGGGTAPLRCLVDRGKPVAELELLTYPMTTIADLKRYRNVHAPVTALRTIAAQSFATFRSDRMTCPGQVSFRALRMADAVVGNMAGLHYQFALVRRGALDELVTGWLTVRREQLVLVVAQAYGTHPCLPPEGIWIYAADLENNMNALTKLVARMRLP